MSFAAFDYLPFLALVLALFQFVPARARAPFLLAASFVFYAWVSVGHALLLAASIAVNHGLGLAIERAPTRRASRVRLALGVLVDVGLLAVFKYGGFVTDTANALLGLAAREGGTAPLRWLDLALPLGISFYTFQVLGYLVDVHRRRVPACRSPIELALYVAFFPQLVAGPIERAGHLLPQLRRLAPLTAANGLGGAELVVFGLFKKLVLADQLRRATWPVFLDAERQSSPALAVAAVAAYAILYLDFSAYTDLARGSARLFGVELVQNFRRPFAARSVSDMTRRWHVSLYTWVRDYAFAGLAKGPVTHARLWAGNLLIMTVFGLWHGAAWSFVLWGALVGLAVSVEHSWRLALARRGRRPRERALGDPVTLLGILLTQVWASLMFVLFFSPSLAFAGRYVRRLFTAGLGSDTEAVDARDYVAWAGAFLALGIAGQLAAEGLDLGARWRALPAGGRAALVVGLAGATVLLRVPDAMPFIYFRF